MVLVYTELWSRLDSNVYFSQCIITDPFNSAGMYSYPNSQNTKKIAFGINYYKMHDEGHFIFFLGYVQHLAIYLLGQWSYKSFLHKIITKMQYNQLHHSSCHSAWVSGFFLLNNSHPCIIHQLNKIVGSASRSNRVLEWELFNNLLQLI